MFATLLPIVTDVKPMQSAKAPVQMFVTLLGIVIDVKPEHSLKAPCPMLVTLYTTALYSTEEGIVMSPLYLSPLYHSSESPDVTSAVCVESIKL